MLVLTRKVGERIYIGSDIYITLLDIDINRVRIGIVAPANMPILREELLTTRQKDNDDAPATNPSIPHPSRAQTDKHRRGDDRRE